MIHKISPLKIVVLTTSAAFLGACGGSNGSSNSNSNFTPPPTATVPPPVVTPPVVDPQPPMADGTPQGMAGAGFAAAFNQGEFADPVSPTQGDIIGLDKTIDPYDIPNP